MIPALFDLIISSTRRKHHLPADYRMSNQTSVINRFIPGTNRRFLTDLSIIEQLIELIVYANEANVDREELISLVYYALAKYAATNINSIAPYGDEIANICAHAILNFNHYISNKTPKYRSDLPVLPKHDRERCSKIKQRLFPATQIPLASKAWLTKDAKNALRFACVTFADPSDIPQLMENLKHNVCFLSSLSTYTPFELAAYVHHHLIEIHPYEDGNGRVARALMNEVLESHGYAPINVKKLPGLEHEYDHVVSQENTRVFADWLKKLYFRPEYRQGFEYTMIADAASSPILSSSFSEDAPIARQRSIFTPIPPRWEEVCIEKPERCYLDPWCR